MNKISLSRPDITNKEKSAILRVLDTPFLALGPKLKEFEDKFAKFIGTKYAIAVNSGTSGLHLVIRAMGIKDGDEVITSPFSFIASANCILFEKAKPVFADIESRTFNISPELVEGLITPRTKAILGVDIFGHPAEWKKILAIARKYKLKVIEDSCEALGAEYKLNKRWIRAGNFGEAAVFAFYPNKQMTTGEGGMIVTNNSKLADLCRSMANQGRRVKNGAWLEHVRLGYNYRMSDINAALGIAQLSRINEILRKRQKVAELYNRYLSDMPEIKIPYCAPNVKISWFVYVIQLSEKYSRSDRDQIMKKLKGSGIQCSNYFQCIHLQPLYRQMFNYKRGDFPVAENISDRTIALPFYSNLTEKEIKYIVKNLKEILSIK